MGNLSRHREGIPLSELSKTLRESVVLAKGLGFRYLWIDALCIIQDSDTDWAEQAAMMASIYQGCSLNIAIMDSPSCDAGFMKKFTDECPRIASSGVPGKGMDIIVLADPNIEPDERALARRGWAFQETLVSVATVSVSNGGLEWDCCSATWADDGRSLLRARHYIKSVKAQWASCEVDGGFGVRELSSKGKAVGAYSGSLRAWHKWISRFSSRALTEAGDKLPAVAGIASRFSASGLTYAAGLWKEDLNVGLSWCGPKSGALVRRHYRAPSWSWASVDGLILYPWWVAVSRLEADISTNTHIDLQVTDVFVDERQPGTFGSVYGGRIEAVASLYQGTICGDPRKPQIRFDSEEPGPFEFTLDETGHFDGQPQYCWLTRLYSVVLRGPSNEKGLGRYFMFCLILEEVGGGRSEFRRVGLAQQLEGGQPDISPLGLGIERKITMI